MIRSLRARHRRVTTGLALVVPALFLAGLAVRPSLPVSRRDAAIAPAAPGPRLVIRTAAGRVELDVDWGTADAPPDLLAYWHPRGTDAPGDAILLGRIVPHGTSVLGLPPGSDREAGRISIYSLAHGAVVASTDLP